MHVNMKVDRDALLMQIRPKVDLTTTEGSEMEIYQEKTIRPIMQLQNNLIVFGFKTFLFKTSSNFASLSPAHQKTYINDRLRSDPALKNSIINYVVALFDTNELRFYSKNRLEIRKRIIELCISFLEEQLDKLVQD